MMRLLWAVQYRFCKWLQRHTRVPHDVDDYLMAYPDAKYGLHVLTPKMQEAFNLASLRPAVYRDPECGDSELCLVAYIPDTMQYEDAEQRIDKVRDWLHNHPDSIRIGRHIRLIYEWPGGPW